MIDRFFYKFFGLLDDFFDRFISDAQPLKKRKRKKTILMIGVVSYER